MNRRGCPYCAEGYPHHTDHAGILMHHFPHNGHEHEMTSRCHHDPEHGTPENGPSLFHQMGKAISLIAGALDDEGDRVYLGSTNHADLLRDLRDAYDRWRFEHEDDSE